MTYNKDFIKGILASALEKKGMSLETFEAALAAEDKVAVEKHAGVLSDVGSFFSGSAALSAGLAGAGGAAGGMLGYKAYDSIKDTDKEIQEKMRQRKKIILANKQLASLLQSPIQQ